MREYGDRQGGQQDSGGPGVSRRALLAGGGGLMLAVATMAGCAGGGLAGGPLDQAPTPAARKAAWLASPGTSRRPGRRARAAVRRPRLARVTRDVVPAQPVHYVDDGPMVIALTIDDGPSPVYTPQILRLLERYRVTASFSMIGESAAYYPGIARDVADAGHTIVNHTWNHANLTLLNAAQVRAEISRATDAIHAAAGKRPGMFRAPYGAWSAAALDYCAREGLMPLDWSVDPRDWSRPGTGAIIATIMRSTRTGSIILEHDGGGDRSQTVAALKAVIPRLLDEGYRFRIP
jgi:peptidoglycan/xylan/chitin deacetylase (PgdA/CDA1 family)